MNGQQKRIKNMRREENEIQRTAKMYKQIRDEGVHSTINAMHPIIFYSIYKAFDLKSPSIGHFAEIFNNLITAVSENKVTPTAIMEDLKYETGIELLSTGEYYFPNRRPTRKDDD